MLVIAMLLILAGLPLAMMRFAHRCQWSVADTLTAVLVPASWVIVAAVSKVAIWHYTRGKAVWFSYGLDKGLGNFFIEAVIVVTLLAWYFAARAFADWPSRRFAAMRIAFMCTAAFVAIALPPFGE